MKVRVLAPCLAVVAMVASACGKSARHERAATTAAPSAPSAPAAAGSTGAATTAPANAAEASPALPAVLAGWIRFRAEPCNISLALPTQPTHQHLPDATGGQTVDLWTATVEQLEYNVTCSRVPVSPEKAREVFVGEALTQMYDRGVEASLASTKGKLLSRSDAQIGGRRGVDFVVAPSIAPGKITTRMVQVDERSVGLVIHEKAGDRPDLVAAVLASLQVN